MRRAFAGTLVAAALTAPAAPVHAGPFTDDLSRCLVSSSSDADRLTLLTFIYTAISAHPAVKAYSNLTPMQIDAQGRRAEDLFTRLLSVDCRAQTLAAVRNEGPGVFQDAFKVLGEASMASLIQNPEVKASLALVARDLDLIKLRAALSQDPKAK